jgi:hypothetical protein
MNIGRFVTAAITVWIARTVLNWIFYSQIIGARAQEISAAHPDMFRQVVPAFILSDLLFAVAFTYLFVKVGAALGGGRMAGVKLGLLVAVLSPVMSGLYQYFSVTYLPLGLMVAESAFQVIAHVAQGVVAGTLYKIEAAPAAKATGAGR